MWIFILAILIISFMIISKKRSRKTKTQGNIRIKQSYISNEGKFYINGKKNSFSISKNGVFEFLVKDGQIVACKDKRNGADFVYYGGEK